MLDHELSDMATRSVDFVFSDIKALQRAYMPFVLDGGIFIPTQKSFQLGEEIIANITLPDDGAQVTFAGEVIWITPKSAHGAINQAGIGVQFTGKNAEALRKKIKQLVENAAQKTNETDTM